MSACACGRPTAPDSLLCVGCERRRTPPVLPALAARTGAYVPAPRVAPAPPRRLPPMAPAVAPAARTAHVAVCVVPYCGGTVRVGKAGCERGPAYAGRCESCCGEVYAAKRKALIARRHGVAA